jgi:acyl-CoA hydrolase
MKLVSLAEAVSHIKSGNRIFIQAVTGTQLILVSDLAQIHERKSNNGLAR